MKSLRLVVLSIFFLSVSQGTYAKCCKKLLKKAGHIIVAPITIPVTTVVVVATKPKELIKQPRKTLKKAHEKVENAGHRTVKEIGRGTDRIVEEGIRIILDGGEILFCPKNSKLIKKGYCLDTDDKAFECTTSAEGTQCQITDMSGNESGTNVGVKEVEQDWDAALSWMRKTEVQDYLQSLENQLNSDFKKSLEENNNLETFRELATQTFEEVRQKTSNGTGINVNKDEQAQLLLLLKGLQSLMKGIDRGASQNFHEAFYALANPLKTFHKTDKAIGILFEYIGSHSSSEVILQVGELLSQRWDKFQVASIEKKGELIGGIGFDFLSIYLSAPVLNGLGQSSFLMVENTSFAKNVMKISNSAQKLGLKTKQQVSKYTEFTNRLLLKGKTGVASNLTGALDEGSRIIKGMEIVPTRTIGQHTLRTEDLITSEIKHS